MGGLVWAQDWLETCLLQHRNVSWIKRQVTRRHDPFGAFRSTSNSHDTTILENTFFEEHSSYSLQLLGGTQSIQASNWTNWVPSVRYNPRPVSYDLEPIYTLLPIGNAQRDALEQATNHYLEEANKEASVYIDQLQVSLISIHFFNKSETLVDAKTPSVKMCATSKSTSAKYL